MRFEWDETKNKINHKKHGVGFSYAIRVFLDPQKIEIEDRRRPYGEQRMIVLGKIEERVFVVVYTRRGNVKRIISARKANERESRKYHQIQTG